VERAQRELRAGLANRLCRDDATARPFSPPPGQIRRSRACTS
jgi:hypothetical protein